MHVEIRLCDVQQACAFDTQSFYRVKQLLASHGRPADADDASSKRTVPLESMLRIRPKVPYTPQLKLQLVVERLIEMESQAIVAHMDKKQHESRTRSNWNNSDVGTAYHSATVDEVILAALPLAAADSVLKIRLLQLPPPLDYDAQQTVKRALGSGAASECSHDTPLCIGVAKITLRELMMARRTVRIAMQAKRTIFSTVEAHNLDTLITNGMFGKGEGSGSALLSLQVNGFTFGRVPKGQLALYNGGSDAMGRSSVADSENLSVGMHSATTNAGGEADAAESEAEALNSPAIRFVLIPYVAFLDVLLRINDAVSWRVPRKTAMALAVVVLALYADLFDTMLVLMATITTLLFLRNISLFYCVPMVDSATRTNAAPALLRGANQFQPYLYSRDNALLNSLLRARVFFSQGLLEDTYFELALSAHLARHARRQIAAFVLAVAAGFLCLSFSTVAVLLALGVFTVYPVYLNQRSARRQRRRHFSLAAFAHDVARSFRLPERLRVIRVVRVAVVRSKKSTPQPESDALTACNSEVLQQQFLGYLRQRADSVGAASNTEKTDPSPRIREGSTLGMHRRARTLDMDGVGGNAMLLSSTIDHFQMTHVMRYFVALCFSPATSEGSPSAGSISTSRRTSTAASLQRRMHDQLRQARLVNTAVTTAFPQQGSMGGATSTVFPAQSSVMFTEAKPSALPRELQESFHAYFNSTISFLSFLRQQSTVHAYVTQSPLTRCVPDSMRSVAVLAPAQCLVEMGDDDGVTRTIVSQRVPTSSLPMVGKFSIGSTVECTGRVMALYAAYLLQGARLSIYTSSNGCSTLVPLMAPGDRIERFPQPNPCPNDLLNTLDSVWRGETAEAAGAATEVFFTADAVIQIILVYKNHWLGDAAGSAARAPARFDTSITAEPSATFSPQRNSIRNVFAALAPTAKPLQTQRSSPAFSMRSPRPPASPALGHAGTVTAVPTSSRADFGAARTGPGSPGLAPLHLPLSATVERSHANYVSDTTASIDVTNNASVALSEPPLLEATHNGEAQHLSYTLDGRDSPDPKLSGTRAVSTRFETNDKQQRPSGRRA